MRKPQQTIDNLRMWGGKGTDEWRTAKDVGLSSSAVISKCIRNTRGTKNSKNLVRYLIRNVLVDAGLLVGVDRCYGSKSLQNT